MMNTFMKIALLVLIMVLHRSEATNPCLDPEVATSMAGASTTLDLSGCGISDADHGDLATFFDLVGRPTILNLDLSDNDLESLPADIFQGMFFNSLSTYLAINNNKLTTLPEGLFDGFTIKFVELENNGLETLPDTIFLYGNGYASLKLTGNNLVCLPATSKDTSYVQEVDEGLKDCRYMDCPGDTFQIGVGECSEEFNNAECGWDAGFCCKCTCNGGMGCLPFYANHGLTAPQTCSVEECVPIICRDPDSGCAPTPSPIPEPTPEPTPAPIESVPTGPVCSNGLSGYDGSNSGGDVCCDLGCGKCGGRGCGKFGSEFDLSGEDCCVNGILRAQGDCSVTGEAPCVVAGGSVAITAAMVQEESGETDDDFSAVDASSAGGNMHGFSVISGVVAVSSCVFASIGI